MTNRKFALVIGNSEYQMPISKLRAPDVDAEGLANVLGNPDVGNFQVDLLRNQTKREIERRIMRFYQGKAHSDLMLLYFSGHGILDEQGKLYFAVKDTELESLRATAISAQWIRDEMHRCFSKTKVLVLDCCHSGAYSRTMKGVLGESVGIGTTFTLQNGSGIVVLTASDATQYSWENGEVRGQAQNSIFTNFLIQGLSTGEADLNKDGKISLDELYEYTYSKVVVSTEVQEPLKFTESQKGAIVIAKVPSPKKVETINKMSDQSKKSTLYSYNPFVFRNGNFAYDLEDLVTFCELYQDDAMYHLTNNHFYPWLSYIGKKELSETIQMLLISEPTETDQMNKLIRILKEESKNDIQVSLDQLSEETLNGLLQKSTEKRFVFLLIGRTGVGKSSTINKLIGEDVAKVGRYTATTMDVKFYDHKIQEVPYTIIDSPGLSDTTGKEDEYLQLIQNELRKRSATIDCVWFVTPLPETRIRIDERNAIANITQTFGKEIWNRVVIVFTFADKSDNYLQDFVERTNLLREEIALSAGSEIANAIPSVSISNTSDRTPDGELWLGELYTTVLTRISKQGFVSFFLATANRVKISSDTNSFNKSKSKKTDSSKKSNSSNNSNISNSSSSPMPTSDDIVIGDRQIDRFENSVKETFEKIVKDEAKKGAEIGKPYGLEKAGETAGKVVGTLKAAWQLLQTALGKKK